MPDLPVRACGAAKLGMVAASRGMELRSGSGVLRGGERAKGVMRTRDLSCKREPIWSMTNLAMLSTPSQNLSWMAANHGNSVMLPHLSTVQLW